MRSFLLCYCREFSLHVSSSYFVLFVIFPYSRKLWWIILFTYLKSCVPFWVRETQVRLEFSMTLPVRTFPVGTDSCLHLGLGGLKHHEGWVSKAKSKTIKKDWLMSLYCEIANCFLIFQKHFLTNVFEHY